MCNERRTLVSRNVDPKLEMNTLTLNINVILHGIKYF